MKFQITTLRAKLGLTFGGLTLLVLVVAGLSIKALQDSNERFESYVQGINARATLAMQARASVDERAIAARNLVLLTNEADRENERLRVVEAHRKVGEQLTELQRLAQGEGTPQKARELIAAIAQVEERYGPVAVAIVDLAVRKQTEAAVTRMNNECRPLLDALIKAARSYSEYTQSRAVQLVEAAGRDYALQRNLLLAACSVAVLAAALAGWQIMRRLRLDLGADPAELGATAQRVARGDLSPVKGSEGAAAGSVLASLAAMQASLAAIVRQVRDASDSIATGSAEIAAGNADLSQRTEAQASALEETAATMDELAGTVRSNADNAQQANQLALSASQIAERGGTVVGDVVATMKGIDESSKRIADIIGVIDGIAFQTNILALNAAVEAARAGEQGRGFAVVAGEVRSLAQRSAQAAKEIKSLITTSVEQVGQGGELVDVAGKTMQQVVAAIRRVSDIVGEISAASLEQSAGVAQIGQAVSQLDHATQQNAALVEESASAAESLRTQARQLVGTVAAFSLGQAEAPPAASRPAPVKRERVEVSPPTARPARAAIRRPAATPRPLATPGLASAGGDWTNF
jgi:methyl-accepting chemotaxis protein-1 (serine sensor receptor)